MRAWTRGPHRSSTGQSGSRELWKLATMQLVWPRLSQQRRCRSTRGMATNGPTPPFANAQSRRSGFFSCSPPVLPCRPAHVSLEERISWLHPYPRGVQLPADGVVLPPLPDWLTGGEPQASEPTEPSRPCPGVSQHEVHNLIRASDTCAPPNFLVMAVDGPGADATELTKCCCAHFQRLPSLSLGLRVWARRDTV